MAITAPANIRYVGGFVAGTNGTTIIRANADLANVRENDWVWNETRNKYQNIMKKVVGATNTTLTFVYDIPGQATTDTMTFIPSITIDSFKFSATATAGSATTISTSGLTASAYVGYILYIKSGTGAGASAVITANTTTLITVEAFYKPNTSGTLITTVTPDNTSVFGIAYNYADIVAAVPSFATWANTVSVKTLRVTKGIHLLPGAGLADVKKNLSFETPYTGMMTRQTSFYQSGKITNSKTGFDGGYIHMEHPETVDYNQTIELRWEGKCHFYGTFVLGHKSYSDTTNSGLRWNTWLPGNTTYTDYTINYDGIVVLNSEFRRITCTTWSGDIWFDGQNSQARINIYRIPPVFANTKWTEANLIIAGGQAVVMDGDIFGMKSVGEALSPAFSRPLSPYQTTLANDCVYLWRANLGNYALTNCVDWTYLSGGSQGRFVVGGTLRFSTKTSAGANLGTVAVGLIKTSDGVGKIVIGKAGANHEPTLKRFITTDANGAYVGPYGTGEGIMFYHSLLTYGGSAYVTTVTDHSGYTLILNKYGYKQQVLSRSYNYTDDNSEIGYMTADPYSVASYATAIAYTGITVTPGTKNITVSGTRTIQELYDFVKARLEYEAKTNDVHFVDPLTTADGVNFTLASDWSITISGSLIQTTKKLISTTFTVSTGGVFEDNTGAIWNTAGTLYYGSHFYLTTKVAGTPTNNIRVAFLDATNTNRTYNTSRTAVNNINSAGGGLAEGYAVWKIATTTYTGHKLLIREYEYQLTDLPTTVNGTPITSDVGAVADAFISAVEATAGAYTGIAVNYPAPAVTVTASHTIQKLYDFIKYSHIQPANYDKANLPLTTGNGSVFQFFTNWNLVVGASGNVTEIAKTITYTGTGALTTSSGGIFEDSTLAQWEASGTVYKGSHFYSNVKAITGGANIQSAIVAYINSTGVDVTYNTSRVNGGIATDASGNAEGYVVFAIGATVNNSINQYIGEYNYQWSTIPKTVSGSPIGSSGSYETVRLVTDTQVTLTKANALAVAGITVTGASTNIDLSDELLTAAYDNLKARQATASTIEAGVKGYINFYSYGLLIVKDGTTYTLKTGWEYDAWNTSETGTFRGGRLSFSTPGTYSLSFFDNQLDFETVGTYDFRNATINGTVELTNTSGGAVTVQLHPDHLYTNTGPTITVEASVAIVISINPLRAGTRFQLYDVTNATELMNEISDEQPEEYNYTYSTPTVIRLRVMYNDGLSCDEWIEVTGLTSAIGLAFNVTPTADLVYQANGVNGSLVTECSISGTTIKIYLDDPDGLTSWQRIYAWYRYYLGTEAGIREQNGSYITMPTQTLIQFDTNVLKINNQDTSPLIISGANIITDSGDINDAFDYAGSNGSINNNPDIVVPFVYASETVNVWNEPPTVNQIADQVWDEAISGHLGAGSTGESLDAAGGASTTPPTVEEIRIEMDANSTMLQQIDGNIGGLY